MELVCLWVEVDEKIIAVAGVAVPKTEQSFNCPELVESLLINKLPQLLFEIEIVLCQLSHNEKIAAFEAVVHAVDGQHVFALEQNVDMLREVKVAPGHVGSVAAAAGGHGVPRRVFGGVEPRHFLAVNVGHEPVVHPHAQRKVALPQRLEVI